MGGRAIWGHRRKRKGYKISVVADDVQVSDRNIIDRHGGTQYHNPVPELFYFQNAGFYQFASILPTINALNGVDYPFRIRSILTTGTCSVMNLLVPSLQRSSPQNPKRKYL